MSERRPDSQPRGYLKDYGIAIVLAVIVAFSIRYFLLEAYRIPSITMKPTLEAGDTIFVAKWPFGMTLPWVEQPLRVGRAPFRGEVVIFSPPLDPGRDFVKRVLGLPGDTVQLKKGKLILNGKSHTDAPGADALCGTEKIDQAHYKVCWEPPIIANFGPRKVPDGFVFVMGDLRTEPHNALQRAGWGMVPIASIKAKALWIWLSLEPTSKGGIAGWFTRIRFERMFRRVE